MAKITLDDITSNYASVVQLNARFQLIEDAFNSAVLYRDNPAGEANSMQNDIDMNSNDLLNVNRIDAQALTVGGQDLTISPVYATSAVNVSLNGGQRVVSFSVDIDAGSIYISGPNVDGERLVNGVDYTISGRTLTLTESYPAGSILTLINYAEADNVLSHMEANVQEFTGDGVTTTFTLSNAPTNDLAITVTIDGLTQKSNSYTLSGSSLIFSEAPPLDADIEVKTFNNLTLGVVENDLGYVNVKDYGAVGDSSFGNVSVGTDDTAAIQAALNTGKDVYFPDGVYRITSSLVIGSQRIIGGNGVNATNRTQTVLNVDGNVPAFINKPNSFISFVVDGFYIYYNASVPTDAASQSNKAGFYITNPQGRWPSHFKIENCTIKGGWYGYRDDSGSFQGTLEHVYTEYCKYGFRKVGGTTILFDTCFALGGNVGFTLRDVVSPTLLNCAADGLTVEPTGSSPLGYNEDTGNFFSGCRSVTISGFDAESNTITGNATSYMYFDNSNAHVSGFNGINNNMSIGNVVPIGDPSVPEENYFFLVNNGSTVAFSGCRSAQASADLEFVDPVYNPATHEVGTTSPHTLLVNNASYVSISGCKFTAPYGGTPTVPFTANAQGSSYIQRLGSYMPGTQVNIDKMIPTSSMDVDAEGNVTFEKGYTEGVYAITGTTPVIDPVNGTIQTWSLSGAATPTESLDAGQSVTLMVVDSAGDTIDWATIGVVWVGGTAPALAATGYTIINLWKVGTTVYGSSVGDVA